VRYKTVQIPAEMYEAIKEGIKTLPHLGYRSVKGFVEDAVRRRLEELEARRNG
jgi:hypothetical protein